MPRHKSRLHCRGARHCCCTPSGKTQKTPRMTGSPNAASEVVSRRSLRGTSSKSLFTCRLDLLLLSLLTWPIIDIGPFTFYWTLHSWGEWFDPEVISVDHLTQSEGYFDALSWYAPVNIAKGPGGTLRNTVHSSHLFLTPFNFVFLLMTQSRPNSA
ncbi:hypothetical protein BDV59DRAFT_42141 [Aspergillus ambiguus]|uniref:uncharacterized protein n=1 Tax=Aspergillus ambiguus TaxID=176160 RepID=UPI003CCC9870